MWPNPQFPVNLVTFTEKILNWKLHFLCSVSVLRFFISSWWKQKRNVTTKCCFKPLSKTKNGFLLCSLFQRLCNSIIGGKGRLVTFVHWPTKSPIKTYFEDFICVQFLWDRTFLPCTRISNTHIVPLPIAQCQVVCHKWDHWIRGSVVM